MMKKRHILHWAMGVVMTPLLGSCAFDELYEIAGGGNGVLSFGVEVNAGAPEVKPMGGATRSVDKADSISPGNAVMSPDVDGFFPTSSVELSSVDGKTLYANCDERRGINMHNNVDYKATRGSVIETSSFYNSFALYGYVYDSGSSFTNSTPVNSSINGIQMTKNGSGDEYTANTNPKVYWPGVSKNATFFAVAPYGSTAAVVSAESGGPKITYTVPKSVESQEDLLVAMATDVICDGKHAPNSLTFNHALAAIRFENGDLPASCTVKNVEISGVYNKGDLSSFESPEWSNQSIDGSGTNTYTITNLDKDVMFLMPQTFPDEAQIKLTLSDDSYYTAKLKDGTNTSWQAGHQYTYKLSVNKVTGTFMFEVTANSTSVNKNGGSVTFNVKSYFHYNDNTKDVPIAWQAKSSDGNVILSGNGGTTSTTTNSIPIAANTASSSVHKTNLQSVQIGTSTDYHDLSYDYNPSKRWTANCYVVNGWGYFKLPLVYGNAIKNGTTNASAYTANTTSPNTAKDFCNRDGNAITDETIKITALSGSTITAKVEWQYVNNLEETTMVTIDKVESESDEYTYLYFHIDKDAINQGNALISVSDNGGILWSWHIWVTDMPWKTTNTYKNGSYSYSFMTMPLGMVDLNSTLSAATPRILNYTFSQTPSNGKSVVVSINQAGDSYPTNTTCTFYQWGRKDPFKPQTISVESGNKSYADAIKNPRVFYNGSSSNYDWSSGHSYQLWNAGNTSTGANNTSTKTIYDPCPPGFKVAPQQAYKIMVDNCGTFDWVNDTGTTTGGRVCSNTSDYWRAFGYLDYSSGSLAGAGTGGDYWSAGPYSVYHGYYLRFNSGGTNPTYSYSRALGFSVRPVSE